MAGNNYNVARFLPEAARSQPDAVAVSIPKPRQSADVIAYDSVTFGQLEARSRAAAKCLLDRGLQRGTRVLLLVRPGLELVLSVFALFRIGAVPVVIDPGMGLSRFLECVRRTQPEAIVGIPKAILISHVFRGSFRSVQKRINVSRDFPQQATEASSESAVVATPSEDLAAILFTSGSTGSPKGVCYAHGMFDAQVTLLQQQYAIEPGEIDLPMLPVFTLFNPALGMTSIIPQMDPARPAKADPAGLVQAIRQNQVTNSFGSPTLWGRICRHCEANRITLPTLKRVLMAGAPAPPWLLKRLQPIVPNGEIHTPYGATEVLPVTTITARDVLDHASKQTESGKGTCVGRPLVGISVRIIAIVDTALSDMASAKACDAGHIGEIVATGPTVTREYDRLPDATRMSKIVESRDDGTQRIWHRMGDVGYLDANGRLWFCGRKAERVVTANETLFTDCIEGVMNAHPKVARSALIGLGSRGQQRPAVVIEPEVGHWPKRKLEKEIFRAELREWARRHPASEAICEFHFHDNFPVDVRHNAKIHRKQLKRLYETKLR